MDMIKSVATIHTEGSTPNSISPVSTSNGPTIRDKTYPHLKQCFSPAAVDFPKVRSQSWVQISRWVLRQPWVRGTKASQKTSLLFCCRPYLHFSMADHRNSPLVYSHNLSFLLFSCCLHMHFWLIIPTSEPLHFILIYMTTSETWRHLSTFVAQCSNSCTYW